MQRQAATTGSPTTPLPSGSKLGAYEVLSPVGSGGMGKVYRARDTRLGREVAIKVLRADWLHDEQRRRRFAQEAQSASALNHPHIITIYEMARSWAPRRTWRPNRVAETLAAVIRDQPTPPTPGNLPETGIEFIDLTADCHL